MDFPDDDYDDELMLSAVESYELQADKVDESVRFETEDLGTDQPEEKYLLALKEHFGHSQFRPLQWKIISSIMVEKRDCCAIMTTGYGKSLCYQFPSVYTNGVTLVVSPLISLMEDQVLSLSVLNIKACLLGSAQKQKLFDDIVLGLYRVVYLTPEYLTGSVGISMLQKLAGNLTLVAIDEAHCVSSWGHDFRGAFRALSCIREIVPEVPLMALTATATKSVLNDIVQVLRLKDPRKLCSGFDRPNLKLVVRTKLSPWHDLQRLIREHQDGSVIVYCLKRGDTEELVKLFRSQGIDCAAYHAGLSLKVRKEVHENFVRDKLRIIVATVAFGMGIDKPDVRCVINYGASREIESYYQEIGRAGRDGQPAKVVTFYGRQDFAFHTHMRQLTTSKIHKNHMHSLSLKFQEYLESSACRRKFIMAYFGDPCADSLAIRANCCDNCDLLLANPGQQLQYEELNAEGMCDLGGDARILLSAIQIMSPCSGITIAILFLRGSNSQKIHGRLLMSPLRGTGKHKPEQWWKFLYDLLERHGFLNTITTRTPGTWYKLTRITVTLAGMNFLAQPTKEPLWIRPKREMFPYFTAKRKVSIQMKEPSVSRDTEVRLEPAAPRTYVDEFRQRLIGFRMILANEIDVMPYMVVSEKCLLQMAEDPPLDVEHLSNYDGLSLSKISSFGARLVAFVRQTVKAMEKDYPEHRVEVKRSRDPPQRSTVPAASSVDTTHQSLLDDDDDMDATFLLEQAVLKTEAITSPSRGKRMLSEFSASAAGPLKYDSDSGSDGDAIISAIPSTQNRPGPSWLSTRSSPQEGGSQKRPRRTIKSVW